MKIIINATNIIEDRPLREIERLINLGKAHLPAQGGLAITAFSTDLLIPIHDDGDVILNSKQQEALKVFVEEKKKEDILEITYADLDGIDVIEPIPIDRYVSFEEPKNKPKKKQFWNK